MKSPQILSENRIKSILRPLFQAKEQRPSSFRHFLVRFHFNRFYLISFSSPHQNRALKSNLPHNSLSRIRAPPFPFRTS